MKQASLALNLSVKKTRKREFLDQMEHVVPWAALVELIAPFYPEGRTGRPPFSLATMLRIHFMQQWFSLSDPAMEDAFFDTPLHRHRLRKHKQAEQILLTVDATLIPAPCPTKSKDKAHIGVDADAGLVHTVRGTSGHLSDVSKGNTLLHSQESIASGDVSDQGIENAAQHITLFALSNLWMVRPKLMGIGA